MSTPVLLVAIGTEWIGTARIPRALAKAGFEVSLLIPGGSLAEHSAYLGRIELLPDVFTPLDWARAFAKVVRETRPLIVIPCDDKAWLLLQTVAELAPPGMHADEHRGLATLIKRSLGDPMHYRTSTNKLLLPTAASALGVRMPASATVSNLREAESFAARHGYPIVLKLAYGFGGDAVATCGDRQALDCALPALRESPFADLGASSDTLLAQAYIAGHITYYFIAAWEGQLLAGYATDRVLANPEPKGPASVIRYHRDPVIRDFAVKLVRGFAMNGLAGLECVVDDRTGEAYVIEINRRVTPGMERGSILGVDVCAALHAAVSGLPSPTRADLDEGETGIRCSFPQEWLRDPNSEWLRRYPADVPWDEPQLILAMLAMRSVP
jgi:hypothetical protein